MYEIVNPEADITALNRGVILDRTVIRDISPYGKCNVLSLQTSSSTQSTSILLLYTVYYIIYINVRFLVLNLLIEMERTESALI